jgi:two-component system OmpR family response regulator
MASRPENPGMPPAAPTSPKTVLVVDDDPEIRQLLGQFLETAGLHALLAADGAEMREHFRQERIDLVVLDIMLPDEGGLDLLRWLREHTQVPVIMVTALSSPIDRVVGLEIGADDYVSKPFEPRELLARIRAVLRRAPMRAAGSAPAAAEKLRFGAWSLDTGSRELRHQDGVLVPLSTSEYRLLCVFLMHPRVVLSRERLVELAHKRDLQPEDRAIDIQVYRLRQRLRDTGEGQLLRTVRNSGYVLDTDVHAVPPDA